MKTRFELGRRGHEQVLSVYVSANDTNGSVVELAAAVGIIRIDSAEQVVRKLRMLADSLEDAEKELKKA